MNTVEELEQALWPRSCYNWPALARRTFTRTVHRHTDCWSILEPVHSGTLRNITTTHLYTQHKAIQTF